MAKIKYSYDSSPKPRGGDRRGGSAALWLVLAAAVILVLLSIWIYRSRAASAATARPNPEPAQPPVELVLTDLEDKSVKETDDAPLVTPVSGMDAAAFAAMTAGIKAALEEKDPVAAKKLALEGLKNPAVKRDSAEYRELGRLIGEANMRILFGGVPGDKTERYVVRSGDSLYLIAIKFNLPDAAIRKANGIPPDSQVIHPGQSLKIYKGDWRIEVGKAARLLYVFDGDELFKLYDIGIGKEGRTPAGDFKIADKIKDPAWYAPDGRVVPFGDKENVLGTRWLKLTPVGATDPYNIGYGIHGTWEEGSITRSLSNGCIRMRNAEVEELFEYIPRQTPVKITD